MLCQHFIFNITTMKTKALILFLFASLGAISSSFAQTTIAAGNWSNPAIWSGGIPPLTTGSVMINHAVILDMDYAHFAGYVNISSTGSLIGNSPMRAFALNYTSGSAILTVDGTFEVARVPIGGGVMNVNGTATIDSLYSSATIYVYGGGTLNAEQFMNNTAGYILNNGTINTINFLNIAETENNGTITASDFCNSKTFTNSSTGWIEIAHDFSNIDTLATPAVFANNGVVGVTHDWLNNVQMNGTGKWCVGGNSWNAGSMTGSFDFCDQTGGNVDFNTGTIAGTITSCVNPCVLSIDEQLYNNQIVVAPNPFHDKTTIQTKKSFDNATMTVLNLQGQVIKQVQNISGETTVLTSDGIENGIYFIQISENNQVLWESRVQVLK